MGRSAAVAPRLRRNRRSTASPGGRIVLAVLAMLGLSGCVALPDAAHPEEPGATWTNAAADAWVVRHEHCGFGGGREHACQGLLAYYRDGSVLAMTYGQGGFQGDPEGVHYTTERDRAAHDDEVHALWDATFGGLPGDILVHEMHARRIDPTEREDVARVVEQALRQARPLPNATFDCDDCGSQTYWAFGAPRELAAEQWGSPPPASKAWTLLEEQMLVLQEWVAA